MPKRKLLQLVQKDIKRIKSLKDAYLLNSQSYISDSPEESSTPYFKRDVKNRIFRKIKEESRLIEEEYDFLYKKYKRAQKDRDTLITESTQLKMENCEIKSQNQTLEAERDLIKQEKNRLQKELDELKGKKSTAKFLGSIIKAPANFLSRSSN